MPIATTHTFWTETAAAQERHRQETVSNALTEHTEATGHKTDTPQLSAKKET